MRTGTRVTESQDSREIMTLKLLIADDERLFRQSLKILLETDPGIEVVAEAPDGQEAVIKARETKPDIVLLDVNMPKMDGIKATKLMRSIVPGAKILMLSVHHDEMKIAAAIKAGASGYILKDTDRKDFIEIIRQTYDGTRPDSPYLAHLTLDDSVHHEPVSREKQRQQSGAKYGLSDFDLKVLKLVTEGLNNEEISNLTHVARETIKGHLKILFRKLQVKNRTEAAVLAVREGLD